MAKLFAFLNASVNKKMAGMVECGYANGYVAVPPEHPFHGCHYDDANDTIHIHGGLTFSSSVADIKKHPEWKEHTECIGFESLDEIPDDYYVFGFDTMHWGDGELDRDWCINETKNLLSQLEKLKSTAQ